MADKKNKKVNSWIDKIFGAIDNATRRAMALHPDMIADTEEIERITKDLEKRDAEYIKKWAKDYKRWGIDL